MDNITDSLFDVKRASPSKPISIQIPFAAKRGQFIMRDPSVADSTNADRQKAKLADVYAIGVLQRDVVAGGPDLEDRAGIFPGSLERPDAVDGMTSLEALPDALECEGTDYIVTSGTGAIDGSTTLGTLLSVKGGKLYQKQTNDLALYILSARPAAKVSGNLRIYVERV